MAGRDGNPLRASCTVPWTVVRRHDTLDNLSNGRIPVFVPCERGISHNEAENATPYDLAAGTRFLAEVMVEMANR